jgi:hypothetical protein
MEARDTDYLGRLTAALTAVRGVNRCACMPLCWVACPWCTVRVAVCLTCCFLPFDAFCSGAVCLTSPVSRSADIAILTPLLMALLYTAVVAPCATLHSPALFIVDMHMRVLPALLAGVMPSA